MLGLADAGSSSSATDDTVRSCYGYSYSLARGLPVQGSKALLVLDAIFVCLFITSQLVLCQFLPFWGSVREFSLV